MSSGYTVAEAIQRVKDLVDDDGTRWTDTVAASAEIHQQLSVASQRFMSLMATKGATRWAVEEEFLTQASDGSCDLSLADQKPLKIHYVAIKVSNVWARISNQLRANTSVPALRAETLRIVYTPQIEVSTTGTDQLIDGTRQDGWSAGDLICAWAAQSLMIKDAEVNPALRDYVDQLRKDVLLHLNTTANFLAAGPGEPRFAWSYKESTQEIFLLERGDFQSY